MKATEKAKEERMYLRPPPVCHAQQTQPWLLMCHGRDLQRHTFYNISEDRYYTRTIPELKNKRIWASFYGWLLADDCDIDDSFLFNPTTLEKIQLPPIKEYRACGLSKPPTDPDCHLLFFAGDRLLFCKLGDDKFAEQSSRFGNDILVAATNCRGKIYGVMINDRTIVTIDFVDSAVQVQPLMDKAGKPLQVPVSPRLKTRLGQDFLIESDGRLLLIRRVNSEILPMDFSEFSVCRVDTSEMTYQEVTNLGEHAIFFP